MLSKEYKNFTVSEGTLVNDMIVDKISYLLIVGELEDEELDKLVDEYYVMLADDTGSDTLQETFEDIWARLEAIAPEGCYFGGQEGDGALIGFWEEE